MTNNTPSGAKIVKVLNQIFVFPSSSSDGLAQICVTLSQWFSHKNSIFHWAVHQPIALLEVWSLMRQFELLTAWLPLRHHFFFMCICMRTNHLAMKLLLKIAELEIQFVCRETWGSVWREPGLVNDSPANTAYIYWGSLWGQTCCSVIDGKLKLKHASAADMDKNKKTPKM